MLIVEQPWDRQRVEELAESSYAWRYVTMAVSIGDRLARQAATELVGRAKELALLAQLLEPRGPLVYHVHGIGGIGKTSLLTLFAAQARAQGCRVICLDCRSIEPTEAGFLHDVAAANGAAAPDGFSADSPTAHILVQVDPDRSIDQTNTTNDSLAAPSVQLKVLTADGQTMVPVFPVTTTTPTTPAPATIPATTTTTTAATATPTPTPVTTPATPAPATIPTRQTPDVSHGHVTTTKKTVTVHTQVVANKPHLANRGRATTRVQPLRLYKPATRIK